MKAGPIVGRLFHFAAKLFATKLKDDERDAAIGSPEITIFLDRLVALYQLPTCLIGKTKILARNEAGDKAVTLETVEGFPYLFAQSSAYSAGAVSMNQFEERHAFRAGRGKSAIKPQKGDIHGRQTFFEIDDLARHRNIVTVWGLESACRDEEIFNSA